MARSAKKKWDESKVRRDESGRFVAQTNVPMLGGAGAGNAQRQLLQQMQQQRMRQLRNTISPSGQQGVQRLHQEFQQYRVNTLGGAVSSAKPRRKRRSSGLA